MSSEKELPVYAVKLVVTRVKVITLKMHGESKDHAVARAVERLKDRVDPPYWWESNFETTEVESVEEVKD